MYSLRALFSGLPQNAKYVNNSLDKVKGFIKNGDKVYVSVAPSLCKLL